MRIVLDTNVLVSGMLKAHSAAAQILTLLIQGRVTLCADARIFSEYRQVLRRPKFGFQTRHVSAILDFLEKRSEKIGASPLKTRLPDPDDEPFLEVALSGGADCLVTGNRRHFPAALAPGMSVVGPAEFLELLRDPEP